MNINWKSELYGKPNTTKVDWVLSPVEKYPSSTVKQLSLSEIRKPLYKNKLLTNEK